jgi:Uma2 family endonuclease
VRLDLHGEPHAELVTWLNSYRAKTPGLRIGTSGTTRLDLDNDFQPDGILFIPRSRGGQARVDADGYVAGAPEFVAEVTSGASSMDLHTKKTVYRRNGVREYLVWKVLDGEIVWFALAGSEYVPLAADERGMIRSQVYPGLWLDVGAMLDGDLERVLDVLQLGLETPEHAAFVQRLKTQGGA